MPRPVLPTAHLEFAVAFREAAKRLRLTREDVARYAGVSPRNVSRWTMGQSLPEPDRRSALLAILAPAGPEVGERLRRALGLPSAPPAVRDLDALRKELELALHAAAERIDCSPRAARAAFVRLLGTLEALGITLAEARAWLDDAKDAWRAPEAPPGGGARSD